MANYIWPLSASSTPDAMNTSFGPRIDEDRWDFHDGIDLPAPIGTQVHAMRAGKVHHAGPGASGGFSSRHVVVKAKDPTQGWIYNIYLHLDSIDPAVVTGASVAQGQIIGTVGDDDATYPHLHMEFRKGTVKQIGSVHPLAYLPYADTANFSPPAADRFNRLDAFMAARLLFGTSSRLEGDLLRVEVDLLRGTRLLTTRTVDFDDKSTVIDGKGDPHRFVNDIGVEGYQKSNMTAHGRSDLAYGILVRKIPRLCDALAARVIDVGGHTATSAPVTVPNQTATDEFVDFENGQLPPAGWIVVDSAGGSGTSVSIDAAAAHAGTRGLLCIDNSTTEASTRRAGIEYALPAGRFAWRAEGWFNPIELAVAPGKAVYLLYFLNGASLSVAARIHNVGGTLRAGLVARNPDGTPQPNDGSAVVAVGVWRKWRLELLRVGTRETTAILYLDEGGRMKEQVRLNWDSIAHPPLRLRAGIGFSSMGTAAKVLTDELWLTECELSP
ncbi:MAG TPA: M23 family metallopeptidase [Ramlibacter sp.]|nr:M23 family metallopeptidase [Ramlibacter sp.]